MNTYHIVTTPNPKLNSPTSKVEIFDTNLKKIAEELSEVLKSNADNGIGLAANQLGYDKSLFVTEYIDDDGKIIIPHKYFVNPKIIEYSAETEKLDEGCLSVPNILLPVKRSLNVKVKAQDLNGKVFKLTAKGLFARLIQHESEHLQGKLFINHVKDELYKNGNKLKKLKIVFLGSGEFAEIIIRGLILMDLNISLIITEMARPTGRTKEIKQTPVGNTANIFKIKYLETENINYLYNKIKKISPDLIILSDFGQKIPQNILDTAKILAINLHPSLLPKYRGATPIQTAILNGDKETGISIIKMSHEIDKGSIIYQKNIEINPDDNSYSLKIRLANVALNAVLDILPDLQKNIYKEIFQDEKKVDYCRKFTKKDGEIDWTKKPVQINRQIKAFFPWPGSYTFINNRRILIHHAHLDKSKLVLDIIQPEGKKVMLFSDFLKGYKGIKPNWFNKIKLD